MVEFKYSIKKIVVCLISILSILYSLNIPAEQKHLPGAFIIACPEVHRDCSFFSGRLITYKFTSKYPASNWKILIPNARLFVLGNGTLKAQYSVAVVPDTDFLTTKDLNAYGSNAKKPKKVFEINKNWPEIMAIDNNEFSDNKRFNPIPDARFYKAQTIIFRKMAIEAITAMMNECESTPDCNLYDPWPKETPVK